MVSFAIFSSESVISDVCVELVILLTLSLLLCGLCLCLSEWELL